MLQVEISPIKLELDGKVNQDTLAPFIKTVIDEYDTGSVPSEKPESLVSGDEFIKG